MYDVEKYSKLLSNIELKYQEWKKHNAVNRLTITDKVVFWFKVPFHEIHGYFIPDLRKAYAFYQNGNWDGRKRDMIDAGFSLWSFTKKKI